MSVSDSALPTCISILEVTTFSGEIVNLDGSLHVLSRGDTKGIEEEN